MNTTLLTLTRVTRDYDASLSVTSQRSDVSREIAYYRENIGNIETPEQLVNDRRLFAFAMRAHGLEEMSYAKAFMLKVLREGRDDDTAFANTLTDPRYREFAKTFDFKRYGPATTAFSRATDGVVNQYLVQTLESDVGTENQGARLALYFRRKVPEVNSYLGLLADKALAEVVRTTLGIPDANAALDLDRQVAGIQSKLDLADLKDPQKLTGFINRFAALWDVKNGSAAATATPALSLFGPSASFSPGLLLSIQKTRI